MLRLGCLSTLQWLSLNTLFVEWCCYVYVLALLMLLLLGLKGRHLRPQQTTQDAIKQGISTAGGLVDFVSSSITQTQIGSAYMQQMINDMM